jgi:hypothetical protein
MTTYLPNDSRTLSSRSSRSTSSSVRRRLDRAASPNAQYARYIELARAAALTGDAVETENYYQHAEHYYRMMRELSE